MATGTKARPAACGISSQTLSLRSNCKGFLLTLVTVAARTAPGGGGCISNTSRGIESSRQRLECYHVMPAPIVSIIPLDVFNSRWIPQADGHYGRHDRRKGAQTREWTCHIFFGQSPRELPNME